MRELIALFPSGVYGVETELGIELSQKQREESVKHTKKKIGAIKTWCNSMLSRDNKRCIKLEVIEFFARKSNEFYVGLIIEFDEDSIDVADALLGRVRTALPATGSGMKAINEACPDNPASVKVVAPETNGPATEEFPTKDASEKERNSEYTVVVDNPDARLLIDELRKTSGRQCNTLPCTTKGDEIEMVIHQAGPTVEDESQKREIEVVVRDWSDDRGTAIIGYQGNNFTLNWQNANEEGIAEDYVRNSMIDAMRDRAQIKLRTHVISQAVCGSEKVRGFVLHEYLDRVQGELDI